MANKTQRFTREQKLWTAFLLIATLVPFLLFVLFYEQVAAVAVAWLTLGLIASDIVGVKYFLGFFEAWKQSPLLGVMAFLVGDVIIVLAGIVVMVFPKVSGLYIQAFWGIVVILSIVQLARVVRWSIPMYEKPR